MIVVNEPEKTEGSLQHSPATSQDYQVVTSPKFLSTDSPLVAQQSGWSPFYGISPLVACVTHAISPKIPPFFKPSKREAFSKRYEELTFIKIYYLTFFVIYYFM